MARNKITSRRKSKSTKGSIKPKSYYIVAILLAIMIVVLLVYPSKITSLTGTYSKPHATQLSESKNIEPQPITAAAVSVNTQETKESEKPKEQPAESKTLEQQHPTVATTNQTGATTPLKANNIDPMRLVIPSLSDSTLFYYNSDGRYYVKFSKEHKIPLFVSYILTSDEVSKNIVERSDNFTSDKHYQTLGVDMANDSDYKKSGYDRGHMLPSADRNDSKSENKATFYYSNITPQLPALNRGTLARLEKHIRTLATKYDTIYVVTGSILTDNASRPVKSIGKGVAVPQYIYKVVATLKDGNYRAAAFLMPNIESASMDFEEYIKSVDDVEKIAGRDFFHLLPDQIENISESKVDSDFIFK
ncbi:MAG: DNA/RNA non-specific endonuclease [Rikenellaceae bacterium]